MILEMDYYNLNEIKEILVATDSNKQGAGRAQDDDVWTITKGIIAKYDLEVGKLDKRGGIIIWNDEDRISEWKIRLDPEKIYHLRVKTTKEPNVMYLQDIIEENAENKELEKILKDYIEDIIIEDSEVGTFIYVKQNNYFEQADFDWLGEKINVTLLCEDDNDRKCEKALMYFKNITNSMYEYDKKLKEYVAMTETVTANAWQYDVIIDYTDYIPITPKEFEDRISLKNLMVDCEGKYEFAFDDDDLFWGHLVKVWGDVWNGPSATGID